MPKLNAPGSPEGIAQRVAPYVTEPTMGGGPSGLLAQIIAQRSATPPNMGIGPPTSGILGALGPTAPSPVGMSMPLGMGGMGGLLTPTIRPVERRYT